jgi:hypothetical protein
LFALACAPDNGLSGSMSEVFPLEVSRVELKRNEEAIQVTYLRNRGVFLDVVARVSVALKSIKVVPNVGFAIDGEYEANHPRAIVTHAPGGEPIRLLPPIERGELVIQEGGGVDQVTRGSFSILFKKEGGEVGFGRTLNGTFFGKALDAGFGPLP